MELSEKINCRANGEVIFRGATAKFQLKKGLTPLSSVKELVEMPKLSKGVHFYENFD